MEKDAQIIKQFQLDNLSIKEKSNDEYGLRVAKYIDASIGGNSNGYYFSRNTRYALNRAAANGRVDLAKFKDLLEFDGKVNYANINWSSIKIQNRIISGLIGRWMGRNEKVNCTATDALSIKKKKEQYDNLDFIVYNRERIEKLQAQSGVQMIPQDQEIPADKDELHLWVTQMQRLPEEISYEISINDILAANGFMDVQKEKLLHDSSEVGFVGTYTWMDGDGIIHVEWVKPENALYSYSEYPDFRDTSWRGRIVSLKISELRKRYGVEFGGKLTEEQLWNIAATAKEYQLFDKLRWLTEWTTAFLRPYDEWNVDVIEFELKTVDNDSYTKVTTKKNKSTIIKKGVPEKLGDNEEAILDTNWNIYRGVMTRTTQVLLEWGLKDNMIRPQDPKEIGNAEFSYSFYMYQNYDMRNVAVPEKIEEPAEQMILARLKMQQLVAKMRPTGAAVNWDALQEIDYGLGEANKTIDPMKLYNQTGDIYYRGKDAEGNNIPVPIAELQNTGFLGQMEGLIKLYQFHYQVLKDELGEDPNLISQALQPRVTEGNVSTAERTAENATDYMYDAYLYCMEDTSRKVACLLKNSVVYGSTAYRALIKDEDATARIYDTRLKMLPTDQEIAVFAQTLQQAIISTQELVLYIDPFQLMRVAKEDVKLAEVLFRRGQKRMIEGQMKQAQQNAQLNAQAQQQSLQMKQQADKDFMVNEITLKGALEDNLSKNKQKEAIINMIGGILSKGLPIPSEWKGVETEIIQNIGLPLFAENMANVQAIQQGIAAQQGQQPQSVQEEQQEPMQETQAQEQQEPQLQEQ